MAEEADPSVRVGGTGLGFGDVVEQGRQLEHGAASVTVADNLGEIGVLFRRPGRHGVDGVVAVASGDFLGILDAMEQVAPYVPVVVRPGLLAELRSLQLGDDAAEKVEAIQDLELRSGAGGGQDGHELVADALGRHAV